MIHDENITARVAQLEKEAAQVPHWPPYEILGRLCEQFSLFETAVHMVDSDKQQKILREIACVSILASAGLQTQNKNICCGENHAK